MAQAKKTSIPTILVIPDVHAHPDLDNNRLTYLGNMIVDQRPDEIWCLGDWADMPSLSSYDKGQRSFEGRRYKRDVQASIEAQEALFAPIAKDNKRIANNKKAQYRPVTLHTRGNHGEGRINRVTEMNPELEGTVSVEDLGFENYWDIIVPFKQVVVRHGFAISHYFTSGIKGNPIGGVHAANSMLSKLHMSAIAGHSHVRDFKEHTRADGTKIMAIVAGCYAHPNMIADWNMDTHDKWWHGVVVMRDVHDGYSEQVDFISADRVAKEYK